MDPPSEPNPEEHTEPATTPDSEAPGDTEDRAEPVVDEDAEALGEGESPDPAAVDDEPEVPSAGSDASSKSSSIRMGAVVALALAAAFVVWLFVRDDDSSPSVATQTITTVATTPAATTSTTTGDPSATSEAELKTLSVAGSGVYWAGRPETGYTVTLVKGANGSVYVRYLPPGVKVSDPIPPSLVVATYPLKGALAAVKRAAKSPDTVSIAITNGGTAVYAKSRPTNVYFAYPKSSAQIEVYDPSPGRALQLVTSGTITPVAP